MRGKNNYDISRDYFLFPLSYSREGRGESLNSSLCPRGRLGGSGRDSTPTLPSTHQSKARCGTSLKQEEGEGSFSKFLNSVK